LAPVIASSFSMHQPLVAALRRSLQACRVSLPLRSKQYLSLLLLFAAFFVLELAYPRFPVPDEIAFKSAGRNASHGGAFAAPELEGYLHADPPLERVYFIYPPLYTWLFSHWTRMTGFGWAACVGYDALISASLAFIIYGLADAVACSLLGPLSMRRRTVLAFVAALLTLLFRNPGRPDELGMALGFANAWWLFLSGAFSPLAVSFASGVLAGLMLCTSPAVFLAFAPFLAALWLRGVGNMREIAPSLVAAALGCGLMAALCLTPLFLVHPHFYWQFFQHVQFASSKYVNPMFAQLAMKRNLRYVDNGNREGYAEYLNARRNGILKLSPLISWLAAPEVRGPERVGLIAMLEHSDVGICAFVCPKEASQRFDRYLGKVTMAWTGPFRTFVVRLYHNESIKELPAVPSR
jgi:hypothetical protein